MKNMEMKNMDMTDMPSGKGSLGSFAAGLCCGAVIGAALALIYAPKPGAEMRRDLAEQSDRLRRRANEQADRFRRRASEIYSGASETVSEMVQRGRGALEVGREAYRETRPDNGPAHDMPPMA